MARLAGKVAVVAGAGGIGDAVALRLVREGCDVALGDLFPEVAEAGAARAAAEGPGRCIGIGYDQRDEASVASLFAAAHARFGRIDFLHANAADSAAIRADGNVLTLDTAVFDTSMAVNARGALFCTRHALPHLLERGGAIVYTSSGSAYIGETERVAYAMTKAALGALARHVARTWGKQRVRANCIAPGAVLTETLRRNLPQAMLDQLVEGSASWRAGLPEDIAAMVAMLFSDDGEWINGQAISVDGGSTMRP